MTPQDSYIGKLILAVGTLVKGLLPIAGGIALLIFLWGLAIFIFKDDKKEEGRNRMVWGVIALFVMIAVWGLVGFLRVLFGVDYVYQPVTGSAPCGTIPVSEGGIPCR